MHELEARLRANPEDEEAWGVYGDWLLEQGDRRGELVRSQRAPTADERTRWRGPIPEKVAAAWSHGFVTALDLPLDPRSPALLASILAAPEGRLVSALALRPLGWPEDAFFEDRDYERERSFDAFGAIVAMDLGRLRALGLRYTELTDARLEALVALKLGITELDLRYTELTDARLARVMQAPWFAGVRRLHLQRNPLTDAAAQLLASHRLDYLDIRDTAITEAAAQQLGVPMLVAYGEGRTLVDDRPRELGLAPGKLVDGLEVSPRRTGRFTAVRYIAKTSLSRTITKDCARAPGLPGHVAVYVDPDEWSFRTFENIVPLDRLLPTCEVTLADHVEVASEVHRFALRGELPAFDELGLYTQPLNGASRGGQRYIFHAAPLAEALARAIRAALPDLKGFSHVNPVFRCNRFEPGDEPFHRHRDTPYYDAARNHISQYTLIIYLTGGSASPALQIEDLAIGAIEPMTCFVFHQAYEHAGAAYADGRKVFLRTELVFEDAHVTQDPRIARLFAKACYLTGEGVRDPALARAADRAYDAVAAAHWTGVLPPLTEPFVHKQFGGVHWLANGYDFWFPRQLPLADCAALTLLDYFNCKLRDDAFRTLATSEVVFDFFRNGWAARHETYRVPVPRILVEDDETIDDTQEPWFDAASRAAPTPNLPPVLRPGWGNYHEHSPVLRELYADRPRKP